MADRIQFRRDSAANWTAVNPILAQGEMGIVTDVTPLKAKIGDGVKAWNDLAYSIEVQTNALTLGGKTLAEVQAYTDGAIYTLIGGAPEALDTLYELANALGNDPNFSATVLAQIGTKANSADVYTKTAADARFAPGGHGLGGSATVITNGSADTIATTGWYCGYNITGSPDISLSYNILHTQYVTMGYADQVATAVVSGLKLIRNQNNGTWSPWRQLAFTDNPVFSGNVGIGTTPDSYAGYTTLSVGGNNNAEIDFKGGGSLLGYIEATSSLLKINAEGSKYISFSTNSAERMRITAAGNVGIGVAAPKANFHSAGSTGIGVMPWGTWNDLDLLQCAIQYNTANKQLTFGVRGYDGVLASASIQCA